MWGIPQMPLSLILAHALLPLRKDRWQCVEFSCFLQLRKNGAVLLKHARHWALECMRSVVSLCDPIDRTPPGSSLLEFSRQEYWGRLPFPSPGHLPDSGIEPMFLVSSLLQVDTLPLVPPGKPWGPRLVGEWWWPGAARVQGWLPEWLPYTSGG